MKWRIRIIGFSIVFYSGFHPGVAQNFPVLNEKISVVGRPAPDSVMLRWAPLDLPTWLTGNQQGYTIEKYVMVRNGLALDQPEKIILNNAPIKPFSEDRWEPIVPNNQFAAIAAQALFGEDFQIDLSGSDVFQIINKSRENEQRYSFALFSADMSTQVAEALGLLYVDRQVKKGEKYLYRILINAGLDSLRGSIFIGPDDEYFLSPPRNLNGEAKDHLVSLRWDKSAGSQYTAFIVERASDGKAFAPVSETPLVTISPTLEETRFVYAIDSLPDLTNFYSYRIKGLTPFGEHGPASDTVRLKATSVLTTVPYITSVENIRNQSMEITWDFPETQNELIRGFSIERAKKPSGTYEKVNNELIPKEVRTFQDSEPDQINYYKITAHGLGHEALASPVYYAQLVDSIPPVAPTQLSARVNEKGHVELTWARNTEEDMYGYRIYRSNYEEEELSQITIEPVANAAYHDTININTLNEHAYYQVMAIDRNQNHSALSAKFKLALPDIVKPQPPVFLPVQSDSAGVLLRWQRSASTDVVSYNIYRRRTGEKQWSRIKTVPAVGDTITYSYRDGNIDAGSQASYTVVSTDDVALESEPSLPVSGQKIRSQLSPPVEWREPVINREQHTISLSWTYRLQDVRQFRIYRSQDEGALILYKSISGEQLTFSDRVIPGKTYGYKVLAVFTDGSMSRISEELGLKY